MPRSAGAAKILRERREPDEATRLRRAFRTRLPLKPGVEFDNSADAALLVERLRAHRMYPHAATLSGSYYPRFLAADVWNFQVMRGLPASGALDTETWSALCSPPPDYSNTRERFLRVDRVKPEERIAALKSHARASIRAAEAYLSAYGYVGFPSSTLLRARLRRFAKVDAWTPNDGSNYPARFDVLVAVIVASEREMFGIESVVTGLPVDIGHRVQVAELWGTESRNLSRRFRCPDGSPAPEVIGWYRPRKKVEAQQCLDFS